MSIKKCSLCNAEYDDEVNSVCPVCGGGEDEASEISEETTPVLEETSENESDAIAVEEDAEKENDGEEKVCVCKKKPLAVVAIILAVLVVIAAAWLVYAKVSLSSYIPDPINAKSFTVNDVEGTYTDNTLGVQYAFKLEPTEAEVVREPDPATDSAADSAANSAAEPEKMGTEFFDGTFLCSYNKDIIPEIIARDYVSFSHNTEDYAAYKAEKKLKDDDYLGYVKSKDLTDEMDKFDMDNNITASLEAYSDNGYWKYEHGIIAIYGDNAQHQLDLFVTDNGLIQDGTLFAGKIERKEAFNAQFTMEQIEAGTAVNIRLYKDGYFLFENVSPEGVPSIMAGTYRIEDGKIYLNLEGNESAFYLTDSGLTPYLFVK